MNEQRESEREIQVAKAISWDKNSSARKQTGPHIPLWVVWLHCTHRMSSDSLPADATANPARDHGFIATPLQLLTLSLRPKNLLANDIQA